MDYFTADTHFKHKNIIQLSKRPFKTIEEHDKALIKNWNQKVEPNDTVYILGDLSISRDGKKVNSLLQTLNGKKRLIVGNHDSYLNDPNFDTSLFEFIKSYYEFTDNKEKIVLSHYPMLEWNGYYRNSIHLYGHVHNSRQDYFSRILPANAVNVGVDVTNYTPLTLNEIRDIIKSQNILTRDLSRDIGKETQ